MYKKVPDDTFRILFHQSTSNDNINFLYDKIESFSFVIGGIREAEENISAQSKELLDNFYTKFRIYFSQQIKKKIYKNCLYYYNNKEYLNGKNLKNKIIYDLKKLNLDIKVKNDEKSFFESNSYKALLNIIDSIDLEKRIKSYYSLSFSKETKEVLGLKDEHFESLAKNKFNVLEEFCCWRLYEMFFDKLLENIIS